MATEEERVRRRTGSTPLGEVPVFDAWTPVSFKQALGNVDPFKNPTASGWMAPMWVGYHARRLQAYTIYQAFIDNASRFFLTTADTKKRDSHREYGDAALIRDQILGAMIGADQTVVVEDASDFSEDLPEEASELEQQKSRDAKPAHDLQMWFEEWADAEKLPAKIIECERDAVGLGDGVYVLTWSKPKDRVRVRVYDPGFYFPVEDDGNEDDFPSKVHVAWELEPPIAEENDRKRRVRRLTWELRDLPNGGTRTYAWNDGATPTTCYFTDGVFVVEESTNDVDGFKIVEAQYARNSEGEEVRDLDLEIDFLPIVHVPNTVALKNHYGRSSLATVLQVLDDLANADTDLQAASATTGKPIVGLSGATFGQNPPDYAPGAVWELGADGKLTSLDTSQALGALMEYTSSLLKRISVNARIPEAVLGRIDKGEVGSGIQLRLMFGPLEAMVREMRLVRDEKYPLLLKFVHRMAVAGKQKDAPPEYRPAAIAFGSFLPQDLGGVAEIVIQLLTAKSVSIETGIQMLLEAGVPIEDVIEEIKRIERRDFAGAAELLDATGDEDAVFDYLQRERPPEPTPQEQAEAQAAALGANRPPPPGAPPAPAPNLPPPPAP